ncbi:GtrA family protein [Myxococcota bacterium]|nr:GtrA family protein [Myxococcota bacterium]
MDDVLSWLRGDLSANGRIWSAVAPVIVLGSYFLLGLVIYLIRLPFKGHFRDAETEARGTTPILGRAPRAYFTWVMGPIWELFHRTQIPPNAVTTLSVFLAAAAGVTIATGRFSLGGWLYLFAGACDFIDGRLARKTGRATPAGAVLDSTLDRYAEAAVLVGLAWYYRDSWVLLAVLATLVGSFAVPYVRARGEGLGVVVKDVGAMQRPERLVITGVTIAFSPIVEALLVPEDPHPIHRLAVLGICVLAATTHFTAFRRMTYVMRALEPPRPAPRASSLVGESSVFRSLTAAVAATGIDFLTVMLLVQSAHLDPRLGTAIGCIVGGLVNFGINRVWTFASNAPAASQAWRYALVSTSSALLNSGGVAVLLFLPGLDYRIAWGIARAAVFLTWNYPLHRDYVFTSGDDDAVHGATRGAAV